MNEAVDFNELRLLCLLVMLAADICFQYRDFKRAFYFYNQAVALGLSRNCLHPTVSFTM